MTDYRNTLRTGKVLLAGLLIGSLAVFLMVSGARADAQPQHPAQATAVPEETGIPTPTQVVKECVECHPDKRVAWTESPHAHAFDNINFREGWKSMDQPGECLLCHTTDFKAATGEYAHAGVSCQACHGAVIPEHPAADYPVRSDQESCGTCHPSTLGEAQLSGHTGTDEVGCTDCHDPHSQGVLFENPDDMCKDCHKEDLAAMDEMMGDLHLQENITCISCHTLDVPHTFLYNFRGENLTAFMTGFDCSAEISANMALQTGANSTQDALQAEMNWPVVHRVSRARSAMKCVDCHEMNATLQADFKALGYSDQDLEKIAWQSEEFPMVSEQDVSLLVAKPRPGWSWVFWLLGVAAIVGIFEIFISRKLKGDPAGEEEQHGT